MRTGANSGARRALLALFFVAAAGCATDSVEDSPDPDTGRTLHDVSYPKQDAGHDATGGDGSGEGTADVGDPDADQASDIEQADSARDIVEDIQPDADSPDADLPDADSPDADGPASCDAMLRLNHTFVLDPTGLQPQFMATSAFDGSGVWVVYARREVAGNGAEDIYALRVGCDAQVSVGPIKVNTTGSLARDYTPRIDVENDTLYIVWTSREAGATGRSISYRTFHVDGTPLMANSVVINPQNAAGQPISTDSADPDVAGLPGGGAVIAATFGADKVAGTSQIMVQKVDAQGALVGTTIPAFPQSTARQQKPSIAVESANKIWLSWLVKDPAQSSSASHHVVYRSLNLAAPQVQTPTFVGPPASPLVAPSAGTLSPIAKNLLTADGVYLAHVTGEGSDLSVRLTNAAASTRQEITIGAGLGDGISFWPSVAASEQGGAVAWYYAGTSPTSSEVLVQPFGRSGQSLTPESFITIQPHQSGDAARSPYGPSITYVGNSTYFLTWPEGSTAGTARVMGRFIQF